MGKQSGLRYRDFPLPFEDFGCCRRKGGSLLGVAGFRALDDVTAKRPEAEERDAWPDDVGVYTRPAVAFSFIYACLTG